MEKVETIEELAEMLQQYASELEEGDHEQHTDDYIVDELCNVSEILYKDGIEEGRRYSSFMLITDKHIKVYETIEVDRFMSGTKEKLKVMAILDVKPTEDNKMVVVFLGAIVRD